MLVAVKVHPKARLNKVERMGEKEFKVWTTAAPEDGAANKAVIEALAEFLGCSKCKLDVVRGRTSRNKVLRISD